MLRCGHTALLLEILIFYEANVEFIPLVCSKCAVGSGEECEEHVIACLLRCGAEEAHSQRSPAQAFSQFITMFAF